LSRRTVFDLATFDFEKHYLGIYSKLRKLLKDFDIETYINFKHITKKNNCDQCHIQISEPTSHERAKKKIFKLFVNEPNYLVESELKANKDLYVPNKGIRNYQFDIFVVNVPIFLEFIDIIEDHLVNKTKLDIEQLKELEKQVLVFAVELDGGSHSEAKDAVRDRFFFTNYNIITVRYGVHELVYMEESPKMKKTRLKYNIYRSYSEQPIFQNITNWQIVAEAENLYESKNFHL
jgi:hypothetical protein